MASWYNYDVAIENATDKTFVPSADGSYSVRVSYETCFAESAPTDLIITGLEEINTRTTISPNPVTKTLFIKTNASQELAVNPTIVDATGRIFVPSAISRTEGIELNVEDLKPGLYILKVSPGADL